MITQLAAGSPTHNTFMNNLEATFSIVGLTGPENRRNNLVLSALPMSLLPS